MTDNELKIIENALEHCINGGCNECALMAECNDNPRQPVMKALEAITKLREERDELRVELVKITDAYKILDDKYCSALEANEKLEGRIDRLKEMLSISRGKVEAYEFAISALAEQKR